jgi:hypothetical protein
VLSSEAGGLSPTRRRQSFVAMNVATPGWIDSQLKMFWPAVMPVLAPM